MRFWAVLFLPLAILIAGCGASRSPIRAPSLAAASHPTPTSADTRGAGFITNVVLAAGATRGSLAPIGPTTVFAPRQSFHAIVTVENAPAGSKVRAVWIAVSVDKAVAPNIELDETEVTTEGSRNLEFTLNSRAGSWPVGTYRVEIYGDGALAETIDLAVRAGGDLPTSTPPA